jgi:hypothetical protein
MGRKRSAKQLEVLSAARSARHPYGKENIVPTVSSPPRSATRAQAYFSTLKDRIEQQSKEIWSLMVSNKPSIYSDTVTSAVAICAAVGSVFAHTCMSCCLTLLRKHR